MNSLMETGIVFASVWVKRKENKNSLHENMMQNIATATKLRRMSGKSIIRKVCMRVSPSTIAASSISTGIAIINSRIIQTTKGRLKTVYARIKPSLVSSSANCFIHKKIGIDAAIGGNILIESMKKDMSCEPLILKRASA